MEQRTYTFIATNEGQVDQIELFDENVTLVLALTNLDKKKVTMTRSAEHVGCSVTYIYTLEGQENALTLLRSYINRYVFSYLIDSYQVGK